MKISTHQSDKQPLSLVRILVLTLISLVASVLLYQAWDSDFSYAYRQHLMATDVIELDFNNLQPITIEQSKKDYRLNWWCIPDNSNPDFGDLACNAYLKSWNSIPAMFTAFWFKDGQLHNAKIDVPYWNHAALIRQIKKEYGEPIKRSSRLNYLGIAKKLGILILSKGTYSDKDEKVAIDNLGVWQLKSGGWIITELEPGSNPFSWCTVFWINPSDAKTSEFDESITL